MKYISLSLPNPDTSGPPTTIIPPIGVPTGGFETGGGGQGVIQFAVSFIFVIGLVFAMALVIFSGIQWITSGGDKEKIQKVKARLTYSIVGLIVIVSAFFIVGTVISLLGGNSFYFFPGSNTSQLTCTGQSYVYCGDGRYVCGPNPTDKSACN